MTTLFNTNQSKEILSGFKTIIGTISTENDFEKQRNSLVRLVISSMVKTPEKWDKQCQINIDWIGEHFINRLATNEQDFSKERIDDICSMCFRFLLELYLSTKNDLGRDFEIGRLFVLENIDSFEHVAKTQIEFAILQMPISIFKAISNSDAIQSVKNFDTIASKAEKLKANWDTELSEKENRTNTLKESLEKYENGFNFVGLYQGFDDLSIEKTKEKNNLLFWIRGVSVVIVLPIITELVIIFINFKDINAVKDGILASMLPTVSLVAISIYYFRVLLFNYKSVKSQLLQIDLRKTLCRFIQNYSSYSAKIKKQDADSLAKFESIIFSGIVTEDGKLPSTYDGLEQISKMIKSAKT